ncbi:MAG: hypothetical protein JO249_17615 [Acidobacteria bacterium]|nr:hypothetical protein [Acidobacteriota bacterium]
MNLSMLLELKQFAGGTDLTVGLNYSILLPHSGQMRCGIPLLFIGKRLVKRLPSAFWPAVQPEEFRLGQRTVVSSCEAAIQLGA